MGIKLKWFRANLSLDKSDDAIDTPKLAVYRPYGGEEFSSSYRDTSEFAIPVQPTTLERKPTTASSLASLKESRAHKVAKLGAGLKIDNSVINVDIEDNTPDVSQNNVSKPSEIASKSTDEIDIKNNDKNKKTQKENDKKLKKEQEKQAKQEREDRIKREKEQAKREKEEELRRAKEDKLIKGQQKKYMKEKEKHAKKTGKVVKENKPKKKPESKSNKNEAQAVASVTLDQEAVSIQKNVPIPVPRVANPLAVPGNTYEPTEAFANWDMVTVHRQNIKRDIKPTNTTFEPPSFAMMPKMGPNESNTFGRISEVSHSSDEYNA